MEQEEKLRGHDYAAKILGYNTQYLRLLAREGRIPFVMVGKRRKFSPSALAAFIANGGNKEDKPT